MVEFKSGQKQEFADEKGIEQGVMILAAHIEIGYAEHIDNSNLSSCCYNCTLYQLFTVTTDQQRLNHQ